MAYLVAMKSKDNSTKVGAVIVSQDNEIISTGFNGIPKGVQDLDSRQIKPNPKYSFFEHAERSAIYFAARNGIHTKGCKMFTVGVPCSDCGRGIIQSGISEVLVHYEWDKDNSKKWQESAEFTKQMFKESGVKLTYLSNLNLIKEIKGLVDGKEFTL